MPTLHLDVNDLKRLIEGETIHHPVTGLRVVLDKGAIAILEENRKWGNGCPNCSNNHDPGIQCRYAPPLNDSRV